MNPTSFARSRWQTVLALTLAFWVSSSLFLDFVLMPSMYTAGMMNEPGFASAGYALFGLFNHIELVCGAVVLTGVLILRYSQDWLRRGGYWTVLLSATLLSIALIFTYGLTPEMSALGLQLNQFEAAEIPGLMNTMHGAYWLLEVAKLLGAAALLRFVYRHHATSAEALS